jgi:hypothetical protein
MSMTNLNATNGGFQTSFTTGGTQDTPTKPPTHATIICKLVAKGSNVLKECMQDFLTKLYF